MCFFCLEGIRETFVESQDNSSEGLCIRIRNAWWSWLVVVVYHAKIFLEVGHTFWKTKTVAVRRIFWMLRKLKLCPMFLNKEVLHFKVFHNTILPILHGTALWVGEDAILAHLRRLFRRTRRYHDIQGATDTGSCNRFWYWKTVHIVEKRGYAGEIHILCPWGIWDDLGRKDPIWQVHIFSTCCETTSFETTWNSTSAQPFLWNLFCWKCCFLQYWKGYLANSICTREVGYWHLHVLANHVRTSNRCHDTTSGTIKHMHWWSMDCHFLTINWHLLLNVWFVIKIPSPTKKQMNCWLKFIDKSRAPLEGVELALLDHFQLDLSEMESEAKELAQVPIGCKKLFFLVNIHGAQGWDGQRTPDTFFCFSWSFQRVSYPTKHFPTSFLTF